MPDSSRRSLKSLALIPSSSSSQTRRRKLFSSRRKKIPKYVETFLNELYFDIQHRYAAHNAAAKKATRNNRLFGFPIYIVSLISGTAIFSNGLSNQNCDCAVTQTWFNLSFSVAMLGSVISAGIASYNSWQELAKRHNEVATNLADSIASIKRFYSSLASHEVDANEITSFYQQLSEHVAMVIRGAPEIDDEDDRTSHLPKLRYFFDVIETTPSVSTRSSNSSSQRCEDIGKRSYFDQRLGGSATEHEAKGAYKMQDHHERLESAPIPQDRPLTGMRVALSDTTKVRLPLQSAVELGQMPPHSEGCSDATCSSMHTETDQASNDPVTQHRIDIG